MKSGRIVFNSEIPDITFDEKAGDELVTLSDYAQRIVLKDKSGAVYTIPWSSVAYVRTILYKND